MVYAVQAEVLFSTAQRRNQAQTSVNNYLALHPNRFGPTSVVAYTADTGQPALALEVRFINRADADGLIASFASLSQVVGGFYRAHDCTHDGAIPAPCPAPPPVALPA